MDSIFEQLRAFRKKMLTTIPDPWLFPKVKRVQGFMGVGPVAFVAERPSTGPFASPADRLLYGLFETYGVENSHLSDVIKSREKVGEPHFNMTLHRRVFDRAIEIVRPKLVIAFGQGVYDLLQFALASISQRSRVCPGRVRRGHHGRLGTATDRSEVR